MSDTFSPSLVIDGTLYTLLAFSVITWTLIFFKLWQFTKNGYNNRRFNKLFWDAPDLAKAETLSMQTSQGPQARIAQQGFR